MFSGDKAEQSAPVSKLPSARVSIIRSSSGSYVVPC